MRGNRERHQTRFYAFFALSITAALWIAFSGNLVTLFIGTGPDPRHLAVAHGRREASAGRVYRLLLTTSIRPAPALVWTAVLAGPTSRRRRPQRQAGQR